MRPALALAAAATALSILGTATPAFAITNPGHSASRRGILEGIYKKGKIERAQQKKEDKQDERDAMKEVMKNVDASCMRPVVAAHEAALKSAFASFSASITSALSVRATAMDAAWISTNSTTRDEAVKAAREAFKQSEKTARETMKDARKTAMETYKTAAKKCGATVSDETPEDESDDLGL